jgi:hypothetical protein
MNGRPEHGYIILCVPKRTRQSVHTSDLKISKRIAPQYNMAGVCVSVFVCVCVDWRPKISRDVHSGFVGDVTIDNLVGSTFGGRRTSRFIDGFNRDSSFRPRHTLFHNAHSTDRFVACHMIHN